MKLLHYFTFMLLLVIFSCKQKKQDVKIAMSTPTIVTEHFKMNKLNFTEIAHGSHSNILKNKNVLITNNADLEALYDILNSTNSVGYKIPEIDFSNTQVIGLFMGSQAIEGNRIVVGNVVYGKDATIVHFYELEPSATTKDLDEMLLSHPFYLATIKKTDKPVKFVRDNC